MVLSGTSCLSLVRHGDNPCQSDLINSPASLLRCPLLAHADPGESLETKSTSQSRGQGKAKERPATPAWPEFIKGDLELRRIWGGCWAKWIAPRPWQAPKEGTSPGYKPYMLDQVKTMACSRNQHTGGHRRGTGLCEKGNFDYHPAVLVGFPLLNARKHSRNQLPP